MKLDYFHDTITAISTPTGKGAIAMIRLSGEKAIQIASQIFIPANKKAFRSTSHILQYGQIKNPVNNDIIDEVLLAVMKADKSFTREELVEINSHGGEVIPYAIIKLVLSLGARLADPGEFTKRAYLNGRIDLTQAEAVHEIITAQNQLASTFAISNLEKRFSNIIKQFTEQIVHTLALIEVNIDYPEDDLDPVYSKGIIENLTEISKEIDNILIDSQNGKVLKSGIKVAIVGKTNVGKSSLFNHFNREDRAIVSHIHGTTRDFIETNISLAGIPVELVDTAGFRQTDDLIEQMGKDRSQKLMNQVDYTLWILDQSREWDNDDNTILSHIDCTKLILIINKTDLPAKLNVEEVSQKLTPKTMFYISLINNEGLTELETGLKNLFVGQDFAVNKQSIACNLRQENLLLKAKSSISKGIQALTDGLSYEFIAIDLREALNSLGEIVGEVTTDDILNEIFSHFCIGK